MREGAGLRPLVLKYGGSSLADADRIREVARGIARRLTDTGEERSVVVVVSALGGATNALERALNAAAEGREWLAELEAIEIRHLGAARGLPAEEENAFQAVSNLVFEELATLLQGAQLLGEITPRTRDAVLGAGEQLSGPLVAAFVREECGGAPVAFADARELIVTDCRHGRARVLEAATRERIRERLLGRPGVAVVPGFVAASEDGRLTTLGRGGSDYTAAIIGAALDVPEIQIWSDVDGVMSADPALVPEARSLSEIGYDEVEELSHFGAKVVFEPTIHTARKSGATLLIRNSRRLSFPGTRLLESADPQASDLPVCGITSLRGIALIGVRGSTVRDGAGARERLFRSVAMAGAEPLHVQMGSGQGTSLAVECTECRTILEAVESEFELEIAAGRVEPPTLREGLTLVAVVGQGLQHRAGVSGRIFSALGEAGVNVLSIALGSSGRSVVFLIDAEHERRSLRAVHRALFEGGGGEARESRERERRSREGAADEGPAGPADAAGSSAERHGRTDGSGAAAAAEWLRPKRRERAAGGGGFRGSGERRRERDLELDGGSADGGPAAAGSARGAGAGRSPRVAVGGATRVYLAGVGGVGRALMRQMAAVNGAGPGFELAGIAASSRVAWRGARTDSAGDFAGRDGRELLDDLGDAVPDGGAALADAALEEEGPRVFVDCTASLEVAGRYPALLERGVAVVSANKVGFASEGELGLELEAAIRARLPIYLETTVGAGLPVLRTLSDMVASGDGVRRIEGVLSGTMSYLFRELHRGRCFSSALRAAHDRGMTESDPRTDLSGRDVMRKAVILSRVAGFGSGDLGPLRAPSLRSGMPGSDADSATLAVFWSRLGERNALWAERVRAAEAAGRRLVHLARVTPEGWSVEIEEVPAEHPAASAAPGANTVSVWTDRYADDPLTIQGAGAGVGVTAQGLVADLMRAARERGG